MWVHKIFKIEIQKRAPNNPEKEHQIIQTLCKIGSPQKLGHPSLIFRNFWTLKKVLLNHAEMTEM